ncbi:gliding motility-associated C-terminal domain-containing protein [bacterium]|nr:gliding motility-associated C-terminal domain-containing protein [bacterium]
MNNYIKTFFACSLLLFVFSSWVYPDEFFDDFNDNIFDTTMWAPYYGITPVGELEEADSVLQLRLPPECDAIACIVSAITKRAFVGDFDAQVDYAVAACDPHDHVAAFLRVVPECLYVPAVSAFWSVYWSDFFESETTYVAAYVMPGDEHWRNLWTTYTLDDEGSFRITRTGDTFTFYYYGIGGWIPLTTHTIELGNVRFSLQIQHEDSFLADFEVHYDNFYVEADSIVFIGCDPPTVRGLCMNQTVEMEIRDLDDSVYAPSIDLTVDGVSYGISDPEVDFTPDILTFMPSTPWAEGESIEVCLNYVEDYMGEAFTDTTCWSFVVDTTPPVLVSYYPPDSAIVFNTQTPIYIELYDEYHDVLTSNLQFRINSGTYGVGHPFIDWNDTTLIFDPSGTAFEFPRLQWVHVCATFADLIPNCPPNDTGFCWDFYMGDSIPPEFEVLEPLDATFSSCDDQQIFIRMTDNVGLDTNTIQLQINDTIYNFPENMLYADSTLIFTPPVNWVDNETVNVCLTAGVDVFDISFPDLPYCWYFIIDLSGPVYSNFQPPIGETIQEAYPEIIVDFADYHTTVRADTILVIITVNDTFSVTFDTSTFTWDGAILRLSTEENSFRLSGGDQVSVCVYSFDTPDYCASNLGDTCWEFSLVTGGPVVQPLEPLDGTITACADQGIFIQVTDSNGVLLESLIMVVEGDTFTISSPELDYRNDTLVYISSALYTDGQQVNVEVTRVEDSLNNPFVGPLRYSFVVDLSEPFVQMTIPEEGDVIRVTNPEITVHFRDIISGLNPDSIFIDVNGYEFNSATTGFTWSEDVDSRGGIAVLSSGDRGIHFPPGDTIWVNITRACDFPDYCPPNCMDNRFYFIIESDYPCNAMPNPFTPNGDRFNPYTKFTYEGMDLDEAELTVYSVEGNEVYSAKLPSKIESSGDAQSWDGTDNKGNPVKQGVYIYIIKIGGKTICNGTVTVVR